MLAAGGGSYGNGSQASFGCVLFSGIVPQEKEEAAARAYGCGNGAGRSFYPSGEVGLKQVFHD